MTIPLPWAVGFAFTSTLIELLLVFLAFPLAILLVVGLAFFGTDLLLFPWSPFTMGAAALAYLFAVAIGLVAFSWFGLGLSTF